MAAAAPDGQKGRRELLLAGGGLLAAAPLLLGQQATAAAAGASAGSGSSSSNKQLMDLVAAAKPAWPAASPVDFPSYAGPGPYQAARLPALEHTCVECFPLCADNRCLIRLRVVYPRGGTTVGLKVGGSVVLNGSVWGGCLYAALLHCREEWCTKLIPYVVSQHTSPACPVLLLSPGSAPAAALPAGRVHPGLPAAL